jgi:hypothetical protein
VTGGVTITGGTLAAGPDGRGEGISVGVLLAASGVPAVAGSFGGDRCASLNCVNCSWLACSLRARAAALSKVKLDGAEAASVLRAAGAAGGERSLLELDLKADPEPDE